MDERVDEPLECFRQMRGGLRVSRSAPDVTYAYLGRYPPHRPKTSIMSQKQTGAPQETQTIEARRRQNVHHGLSSLHVLKVKNSKSVILHEYKLSEHKFKV